MRDRGELGVLLLRLTLGLIFLTQGLGRFPSLVEGATCAREALLPAVMTRWSLTVFESIAGFLLMIGVFPRTASLIMIVIVGASLLFFPGGSGFWGGAGGMDFPLLVLAASFYFFLAGAGKYAILDIL